MKKALSLIEVLVSVVLITLVIGALIKTNNQSFKAVETLKNNNQNQALTSVVSIVALNNMKDTKYYLSDLVKGLDIDELDKKFKEIKFEVDVEKLKTESKKLADASFFFNPTKITIESKDNIKEFTVTKFSMEK